MPNEASWLVFSLIFPWYVLWSRLSSGISLLLIILCGLWYMFTHEQTGSGSYGFLDHCIPRFHFQR